MNQPRLKLDRMRPDQAEIVLDTHKVRVCACGRRYGKSTVGRAITLSAASQGYPVLWCAPLFKNTVPLWVGAKKAVQELKAAGLVRISEADKTIEWVGTDGRLEVHSAESADGILGNAYALAVVDEAAKVSDYVIQEVIIPTLADFDGELLLLGSPKGLANLFYIFWQRGINGDPEIKSWQYPTTMNPSPQIQTAAERAKSIMPEMKWRQEFGAEFISDGNSIFTNIDKLATATEQTQAIDDHEYIGALDFGRSNDYSVFITYDLTLNAIVNVFRINEISYERQIGYFKDLYRRFKHVSILAEKNSIGDPLIDQMKAERLPMRAFTTTNLTKNQLVDEFSLLLQNLEVTFIPDKNLVGELRAFAGRQLPSGLWQYNAPSGLHDDCVMAAMLACHAARHTRRWEAFLV